MRWVSSGWLSMLLLLPLAFTAAPVITSPASLILRPTAYPGVGIGDDVLFGRLPGHQLSKRRDNCDQYGDMNCPVGTCFVDPNGLVGCCSVATCVPRTLCIESAAGVTSPCDINTGGCTYCSDSASPYCMKFTNPVQQQYIMYCASYASTQTSSYKNSISLPTIADAAPSIITAINFTPQPNMPDQPSSINSFPSSIPMPTTVTSTTITTSSGSTATNRPGTTTSSISHSTATTTSLEIPAVSTLTQSVTLVATMASETPATQPTTATFLPASVEDKKTTSHAGTTAGIACGASAAVALLLGTLWYTRKGCVGCYRARRVTGDTKGPPEESSFTSFSPSGTVLDEKGIDPAAATPRSPTNMYSPALFSRHPELDGRALGVLAPQTAAGRVLQGLGIDRGDHSKRYVPTNPDPASAVDGADTFELHAPEVGGRNAVTIRPLPASPARSTMPSPNTPDTNNSAPPNTVSPASPTWKYATYTPSIYTQDLAAPDSVPRTVPQMPPSLPQEYSAANLQGERAIYRGLSMHGGNAPWAYLSPEDAVQGGWRNGDE